MIAAHAVPWPTRSSCGPSRSTYPCSAVGSSSNATAARDPADARVVGVDAAVDDGHLDPGAGRTRRTPTRGRRRSGGRRPPGASRRSKAPDQAGMRAHPARPRLPACHDATSRSDLAAEPGEGLGLRLGRLRGRRGRPAAPCSRRCVPSTCSVQSLVSSSDRVEHRHHPEDLALGVEHRRGVDRGRGRSGSTRRRRGRSGRRSGRRGRRSAGRTSPPSRRCRDSTGMVTPTIASGPAPSEATNSSVPPSSSTSATEHAAALNRARVASTQRPRAASTSGAVVMNEPYRSCTASARHAPVVESGAMIDWPREGPEGAPVPAGSGRQAPAPGG